MQYSVAVKGAYDVGGSRWCCIAVARDVTQGEVFISGGRVSDLK